MSEPRVPKRFVGLHGHSVNSIGDAIGLAPEHMDFALKNGADALAITDHGNMSAMSHQYLHQKKLDVSGRKFLSIYGNEMYAIDSLSNWRIEKAAYEDQQAAAKVIKAENKKNKDSNAALRALRGSVKLTKKEQEELSLAPPDPSAHELKEIVAELKLESDDDSGDGGTIVESESESKDVEGGKKQNPLRKRGHLVVLAKNAEGLKTLFELTSRSFKEGFYYFPRTDIKIISELSKGNLIGLSACIGGVESRVIFEAQDANDWSLWHAAGKQTPETFERAQKALKNSVEQYVEAFGGKDNFYLELQFNKLPAQHLVNLHLIEASKRLGVNLVVTADAHYPNPSQWKEREIYRMMAQLSKNPKGFSKDAIAQSIEDLKCELYPKNAEQLWAEYHRHKAIYNFYKDDDLICDAIERTHDIAHLMIGKVEPDKRVKLPSIKQLVGKDVVIDPTKDEDTIAFKELVRLAKEGIVRRKKDTNKEYVDRLFYELDTVKSLKFSKYFLTYFHLMNECAKELFLGNGRGSAGGSVLAWVLGITQVDPIKYGLIFQRFLNKFKKGFPDIDSDVSDRDKAVKITQRLFGVDNVIPVSNFSQLQLKSLVKDLARLNHLPFDEINFLTRNIEGEVLSEKKKTPGFDRGTYVMTYDDANKYSPSFQQILKNWPELDGPIAVLFKQIKSIGRHAGGVLITDNATRNLPLVVSGKGDSKSYQTPWSEGVNFRHLEEFGFLKFDVLGLATLRWFEQTIRKILQRHEGIIDPTFEQIKKFFYDNLHPDTQEFDDQYVYEHVYWKKNYAGVFQIIKPNVQKFLAEMKPTCINDIAIATAIHRPGPLGAGVDDLFLDNRKNPENITFIHPLMEDALKETAGTLVFQEQLLFLVNRLTGISLEKTDDFRKAFTKKEISNKEKAAKDRGELRVKFVQDCLAANQIPEKISNQIFDYMEFYVGYSFVKAHSVACSITSYQCSWLLTYFEPEWVSTYLDNCMDSKQEEKAEAILEIKRLGYSLAKPDINLSDTGWAINDQKTNSNGKFFLISSFSAIKGVGDTAIEEIKANRPYKDIYSLIFDEDDKWRHSKFNRRALEGLIKVGAFESMGLVGPGKMFDNYKQMHTVLIGHFDDLKKSTTLKKKVKQPREFLDEIIARVKLEVSEDWTLQEKIDMAEELTGNVDIEAIVPLAMQEKFAEKKVLSIDACDRDGVYWGVVKHIEIAKTKAGDPFLKIKLMGDSNVEHMVMVFQVDAKALKAMDLPIYSVVMLPISAEMYNDRLSFKTKAGKIRKISTQ
jgi:DNA polymerase-3 subunit alpha